MDKSSRLLRISAIAAALLGFCAPAFAAPSTPVTTKPRLVVWAHTNMENQGAPTLDILDLERYVVSRLERRIENVLPSQTAQFPDSSDPNAYLAELSVDAITPSVRGAHDDRTGQYQQDPVFHVALTLVLKEAGSSRLVGTLRESRDYHLASSDLVRLEPKRAALYQSADALADRFADGISEGGFGEQLRSLRSPGPTPIEIAALFGAAIVLFTVGLAMLSTARKRNAPANPGLDKKLVERLNAAVALWLATDNFSEAVLWEAAHERLANAKVRAAENAVIARHAATTSDFSEAELLEILRHADEWHYRLLGEAQLHYERSESYAAEEN